MELSGLAFYVVVVGLLTTAGLCVLVTIRRQAPGLRALHTFVATLFTVFAVALVVMNPVYGTYGAAWWIVVGAPLSLALTVLYLYFLGGLKDKAAAAKAAEDARWQAHLARNHANGGMPNV